MKFYKVERTDNWSYDDYDSFVCVASSEDEARRLSADEYYTYIDGKVYFKYSDGTMRESSDSGGGWTSFENTKATEINPASYANAEVILASFNAG